MWATSILKAAFQMKYYIPVLSSFGLSLGIEPRISAFKDHDGFTTSLQLIIIN